MCDRRTRCTQLLAILFQQCHAQLIETTSHKLFLCFVYSPRFAQPTGQPTYRLQSGQTEPQNLFRKQGATFGSSNECVTNQPTDRPTDQRAQPATLILF